MFTGLIEELGSVKNLTQEGSNLNLEIQCRTVLEDLKLGDSIAIDGVCQTVTAINPESFWVTAIEETLNLTTLGKLKTKESKINLERCLTPSSRIGGHLVQGHVDGVASLKQIKELDGSYELSFEIPAKLSKYVIHKGSIAINGISLTVASIENNLVRLCIIPKTWELTNLRFLKPGDQVNIEVDQMAKYIEKLACPTNFN